MWRDVLRSNSAEVAALAASVRLAPRIVSELIAVLSRNDERRRAALEVVRLRRRDAASLPSYLDERTSESRRRVKHR